MSIEKIVRMRDISLRRGLAGFLTLVTGVCGIFLFSIMSADDGDQKTTFVAGFTGSVACFGVFISEVFSSLKAQRKRRGEQRTESGQIVEPATELEEPVEEVSVEKFNCVKVLESNTYSKIIAPSVLGFLWALHFFLRQYLL